MRPSSPERWIALKWSPPALMAEAQAEVAAAVSANEGVRQEQARSRALDLAPTIKELQATGAQSLRALAAGLDERGIPAARGGKWSSVQVMRLLEIIANPFDVAAAGAAA
jgi:hypothetical protein